MSTMASTSGAHIHGILPNRREKGAQALKCTPHPTLPLDAAPIWGRTSDGTVFPVPQTHDMLHTLLDPRLSKAPIDLCTVAILLSYPLLYYYLPAVARTPMFFTLFMFWRFAYNGIIGYLLSGQSKHGLITGWATKFHLLDGTPAATVSGRWLQRVVAHDLQMRFSDKTPQEVDKLPMQFKTWILFRHFVDLVLMSDFVSYCLLAASVLHATSHPWYITGARWSAGLVLIAFNLWVKIDAHRVVKDYAWYWGDFFFLEDVNLTFDGVFEMAPHPMYSIGYAAYYGVSLMTSSMTLFTASILAHAAQFAFLVAVENPHIEKTYGNGDEKTANRKQNAAIDFSKAAPQAMLIFKNFNFTRTSDIALVIASSSLSLAYLAPKSSITTALLAGLTVFWRLAHTLGLGVLLHRQSEEQRWTRLHLKFGGTPLEAYQQWQEIYNFTTVMSYVSLAVLCLRELSSPLQVPYWIFRVIVGVMLVSLHIWTSYSIYEELGEYGWFFGDFFYVKEGHALSYSGIYRYLNNPERFIGIAGVWGMALICYSSVVTLMAFFYTFTNLGFIQFVEKPHMRKLYGEQTLQRSSGVSKNFKSQARHLSRWLQVDTVEAKLRELWQDTVMTKFDKLEDLKPRVNGVVVDTKEVLRQYPAKMTQIMSDDISVKDRKAYSLKTKKTVYQYGEPVVAAWTSGKDKSCRDWIGFYRLGENPSLQITSKSSAGRWSAVDPTGSRHHTGGIIESHPEYGQVKFAGDELFWAPGKYVLRYHHDGKHNVLAISEPFEVVVNKKPVSNRSVQELAQDVVDLYAVCKGTKPLAAPAEQLDVKLDLSDNKVLARLTESIKYIYGIDLAPFVLQADGAPINIAERLLFVNKCIEASGGTPWCKA